MNKLYKIKVHATCNHREMVDDAVVVADSDDAAFQFIRDVIADDNGWTSIRKMWVHDTEEL
jgi:predicted kinase